MNEVRNLILFAWVGEDEFGSGEIGLKQALCPAGMIPLISCKDGQLDQGHIVQQLQAQADRWGKTIRLCRFEFAGEIRTITPGGQ